MVRPITHPLAAALAISLAVPTACSTPAVAQQCFLDAQCPDGTACIEGLCDMGGSGTDTDAAMDDTADDDEKLDVGGGIGNAMTCEAASFVATNAGCEFWAVDLPNAWHPSSPFGLDIAAEQTFAVVVANVSEDTNAHVAVFAGNQNNPQAEAIVGPLGTYAFLLPNTLQTDPERNGGGRAFRIESDLPITAYQFQPLDNLTPVYSNDASALLPAHVLQNDYIAVTTYGTQTSMYPSGWEAELFPTGAFVTVVATEDDTDVEFFPTEVLVGGAWQGVSLQRGDTFTILSDPSSGSAIDGSLSGTRVLSSKPIAAFSGNVLASVPAQTEECCLDHVEHQLLPTVAWGARYVAVPPPDPDNEYGDDPVQIHLVGAYDGTQLRYPAGQPDGAPDTFDAHQEISFNTSDPFIVESDDPAKPFATALFLYNSGAANSGGDQGDPGMILMPSLEQLMDRYVFLAPHGYRSSVVTIVAPHAAEVTLDGEKVGGSRMIGDSGGETWGYRRAEIDPGAHVVASESPVAITVVGYDETVSYAYAGGSAVEVINDAPPAP